ncbi:FAD-dependent oxidoreductase [Lacibacterium aquatile]|uniref:FAD-dependent oxidoreductase n=1 Tax=Lacibacterium aquatile TaxID=1168082 RepID=A0ABW5DRV3_9PROT
MSKPKVIVIGAGIMGLATAWQLAKKGANVTVLEQSAVPNPVGSSVDDHRLIRYPYGDKPGFVAMVRQAFGAWDEMWADLGERHYHESGTLVFGGPNTPRAKVQADVLATQGIDVEWLSPAQLVRDYPLLMLDDLDGGFRLPTGGTLRCGRIVAALYRHLTFQGMDIRPFTQVKDVDPVTASVTLADGSKLTADKIVIAAGAWLTKLLPDMASRVTPSRQIVIYVRPPAGTADAWRKMPCLLDIDGGNNGFYLVPPTPGTGLKIGDHIFSRQGDPSAERIVAKAEAQAILDKCAGRFRNHGDYRIIEGKACFYTVEPDEKLLIEARDKALILSPCSGHGFKFGSIVGTRAADVVMGAADAEQVRRWATGEAP